MIGLCNITFNINIENKNIFRTTFYSLFFLLLFFFSLIFLFLFLLFLALVFSFLPFLFFFLFFICLLVLPFLFFFVFLTLVLLVLHFHLFLFFIFCLPGSAPDQPHLVGDSRFPLETADSALVAPLRSLRLGIVLGFTEAEVLPRLGAGRAGHGIHHADRRNRH